jgi:hypothetical protein
VGPSWSSVALRYDVAFNWTMNPFFHNDDKYSILLLCCIQQRNCSPRTSSCAVRLCVVGGSAQISESAVDDDEQSEYGQCCACGPRVMLCQNFIIMFTL